MLIDKNILFCVACLPEAIPIIDYYGLHKSSLFHHFRIFHNDHIFLIISGIGKINAAIALTYILSQQSIPTFSLLINVGIAGSWQYRCGDCFVIDKIIETASGRQFFLGPTKFNLLSKAELYTYDKPVLDGSQKKGVVDMEGSGFYQAATLMANSAQIMVFKVVSDKLEKIAAIKQTAPKLISQHLSAIDRAISS